MSTTVLLVEDSEMVSGALRLLLEATGYDVVIAATVAEAAGWEREEPPRVMLLDVALPDGDGLRVIGELEGRGLRPRAIYALTGHADQVTRKRCLAAGCDDVLVKPVPVQQLLRIVSEAAAGP